MRCRVPAASRRKPIAHLLQERKTRQDALGGCAEIQEAGNLINARPPASLDHAPTGRGRAEKTAGFEVSLKSEIEDGLDLAVGQAPQINILRFLGSAAGPFEGRERPGEIECQL